MKQVIVVFLIILIIATMFSQFIYADSGYCGDKLVYNDNIKWELDDKGLLTLTGKGLMRTYFKPEDVPWYELMPTIKEVKVGEGIRSISIWVFRDAINLEKVTLNKDLEIIGAGAFYGCEKLKDVTLKENVKDIGSYAFYGCKNLNTITNESVDTSIVYSNSFQTKATSILMSKGRKTNTGFIRVMGLNNYVFQEIQ